MVKAQQWLDEMFPSLAGKEKVKRLCIRLNEGIDKIEQTNYEFFNAKLEGELDLNEFKNLEDLTFWGNGIGHLQQITDLKINLCSKLKKLFIDCTNLSELNLRSNQETTSLTIEGCVNLLKIEGLEVLSNLQNLKLWYKNSQLEIPFSEDNWKQGLQELSRKKIHSLEEKVIKNEQILKELADMVLPNIAFDLGKLKQEIARLKLNELSPQARKKQSELEQQINNAKNKIESIPNAIIDLLLETQEQIIGENDKNDPLVQAQLTGQLKAYQSILEKNLSKQELQALLDKKAELIQLKEQIDKLQTEIQQNE
ncbi:uncharacterized protein OCT59_016681 [Rhizophagus irregularis]|uniref:L domain-like protein n=3 Tax=Rhizophagus irregularis TaxID=588596 RepID=A0A015K864_RHIIW|nr:hypothetical protein RirG_039510 [Rhizophagus irregularis DAOM 197198w]UZO24379.1 hypothetical protein OCT59_016681 [Rhizophagus irregularis]CAG8437560.1 9031_t:CDS:1 [Rhizophagus irregularis]